MYRKLGRTNKHRRSMLANLTRDVIMNERIETTEARAKEVKSIVDSIIALAIREKDNFEEVGKLYEKYTSIKEVTREILNEFVERIYIGDYNKETDNRDITIKWRYQF